MASIYDIITANRGQITPWGITSPNIQYTQYTPKEANKTFEQIRQLPEYQAQQAGVDELAGELDRLKKLPSSQGDSWVKPLLALVDSQTGSKLMQGFDDNNEAEKRNQLIMRYQDALANRQKQAADTLMSGLGKFKSGSTTEKDIGITPAQQAELDFKKAKQQQDYELALIEMANKKAKAAKETWTPAEQSRDKAFGADIDPYIGGGRTSAESIMKQIDDVVKDINSGNLNTGLIASGFGLNTSVTEAGKRARNVADQLSMENMRAIFGSQFTKAEGDLLRKATLDTTAGKKQNIENLVKAKNMIAKKIQEMDSKVSYFEDEGSGSLKGYKSLPTSVQKAPAAPTTQQTGPKEGDETTLKSGKKAVFKGGKWQLK